MAAPCGADDSCDCCFLLYFIGAEHGKHHTKHNICCDEFRGGLSHLQAHAVVFLLYAANDVVLIVLWVLATLEDISYVSVIVCFAMFLVNDLYSFINWRKMQRMQKLARAAQKVKAERFCSAFLLLQQIDFSVRAPCALSLRFPCGSLRKVSFHSREMTERA